MGLSMERDEEEKEPEQFSNSEYFTTHNYGLVGGKKWTGVVLDECMCVRVRLLSVHCPTSCVSDYYTAIISGLSLSPSIPPPSISLVPSLRVQYRTKHTVMQRECEAQQSGSNSHHNYIRLLPHCLFHPPLSSLPLLFSLKHPCSVFLLFA